MAKAKVKTSTASAPLLGKKGPNVAYLKSMAKDLGVANISRLNKTDLIHAIQLAEGNNDCYGRIMDCDLQECLFYLPCAEMRV